MIYFWQFIAVKKLSRFVLEIAINCYYTYATAALYICRHGSFVASWSRLSHSLLSLSLSLSVENKLFFVVSSLKVDQIYVV
jgi:hypothetical protein